MKNLFIFMPLSKPPPLQLTSIAIFGSMPHLASHLVAACNAPCNFILGTTSTKSLCDLADMAIIAGSHPVPNCLAVGLRLRMVDGMLKRQPTMVATEE